MGALQFLTEAADSVLDTGAAVVDAGASAFEGLGNGLAQDLLPDSGGITSYMHSPMLERMLGLRQEPEAAPLNYDPNNGPWTEDSLRERLDYEYTDANGKSLINDPEGDKQSPLVGIMGRIAATAPEGASADEIAALEADQKAAAIELGTMRGQTPEEAMDEYNRFRDLQAQQAAMREEKGLDPIEALSPENADHMGSIQQLRFGSYVGEALGIDDAYGALLNPTGGLVGEGNSGYSADPNSVASYHGEAHDAFGYLRNYHDVGPGYMYASPEEAARYGGSDPAMLGPYTGQSSGFHKWNQLLEESGRHDPNHPNDPQEQMRESLSRLGHGGLVDPQQRDPIQVGFNPTPGIPGNPTIPNPLDGQPLLGPLTGIVETVEELIHGVGEVGEHPEWWLM